MLERELEQNSKFVIIFSSQCTEFTYCKSQNKLIPREKWEQIKPFFRALYPSIKN